VGKPGSPGNCPQPLGHWIPEVQRGASVLSRCGARRQQAVEVLQQLIPHGVAPLSRRTKPSSSGAARASARIPAARDFAQLLRVRTKSSSPPHGKSAGAHFKCQKENYATGEAGGGRCRRTAPKKCARRADGKEDILASVSAGGANDRDAGLTNPLALMPPNVTGQQPLPQDRLENAGPSGGFTCAFRQQQLVWPWQQDAFVRSEPAASGARETSDKSTARDAATVLRLRREF